MLRALLPLLLLLVLRLRLLGGCEQRLKVTCSPLREKEALQREEEDADEECTIDTFPLRTSYKDGVLRVLVVSSWSRSHFEGQLLSGSLETGMR